MNYSKTIKQLILQDQSQYDLRLHLAQSETHYFNKYRRLLRKEEVFLSNNGLYASLMRYIVSRKKNKLGAIIGILIPPNTVSKGFVIWHPGIVINANARIGENCIFHGNNCIGNDGSAPDSPAPVIGDNVEIGFGASIIGDVYVANGCKIGAGAVVTKSCFIQGSTLVGIPARRVGES